MRGYLRSVARNVADVAHFGYGILSKYRAPYFTTADFTWNSARFQLHLHRPGHIEDILAWTGQWEPHVTAVIARLVTDGSTFIDVGANIGYHSIVAACHAPGCQVIALEPNPTVFGQLVGNVRGNGLQNVRALQVGAGGIAEHVTLHAQSPQAYNRGSSSTKKNPDLGRKYENLLVPVVTVDSIALGEFPVSLIKIDTEGTEDAVLDGAQSVIREHRPAVVFEFESRYHDDPVEALRRIEALLPGYTLRAIDPDTNDLCEIRPRRVRSRFFRADILAQHPAQQSIRDDGRRSRPLL